MRKNRMMRAASALLVAVLLTTSTISGTFAKYVTEASGSDTARVAKWGVEVGVTGSLFEDSYKDAPTKWTDGETGLGITVQAATQKDDVVAPGTKNEEGISFFITGKPEVDTKIEFFVEVNDNKEVKLPAGTYKDYTEAVWDAEAKKSDYTNTFTLTEDYYPVVFTLTTGDGVVLASGTIADIQAYFVGNINCTTFDANTDLAKIVSNDNTDGEYVLTWAWAFEQNDEADTYLGNVIAGTVTDTSAITAMDISIKVVVTQID